MNAIKCVSFVCKGTTEHLGLREEKRKAFISNLNLNFL